MRLVFLAFAMAGLFVVAADAAAICASPADMKALQAAVLEQELAAAAQSCHLTEDYARFVAAYRDAIVRSDQSVRVFFRHQKGGETYDAYKSRIAHDIAMKSLYDSKFCGTAKVVFDLALGRGKPAEPPALVETGYEGCRPLREAPRMVAKPQPQSAVIAAAKPGPAVSAPAWNADRIMALLRPVDVPIPTPAPPHAMRALALAQSATSPKPALPVSPKLRSAALPPPAIVPQRAMLPDVGLPHVAAARQTHPEIGHPAARYAARERPRWRGADEATNVDDNLPNAYRPGTQWVGAEADDAPHDDWRDMPPNMYRGPDGRWYVRIGHHDRWGDED